MKHCSECCTSPVYLSGTGQLEQGVAHSAPLGSIMRDIRSKRHNPNSRVTKQKLRNYNYKFLSCIPQCSVGREFKRRQMNCWQSTILVLDQKTVLKHVLEQTKHLFQTKTIFIPHPKHTAILSVPSHVIYASLYVQRLQIWEYNIHFFPQTITSALIVCM